MRVNVNRMILLAGIVVYVLLINYAYKNIFVYTHAYRGYVIFPKSNVYIFFIFLFSVLPATWMSIEVNRPSQILYWFLYILTYIPICWIPYYSSSVKVGSLVWLHITLLLSFIIIGCFYYLPLLNIPRVKTSWGQFSVMFSIIFVTLIGYVISLFGFRFHVLSFYEVYSVREDLKEIMSSAPLAAYAIPWLGNVIHPLLMSIGITKNKIILFILGIIGQIYIYSISGYKSIILSVVLFFAILIAISKKGKFFGIFMSWGTVGTVSLAVIAGFATNIALIPYLSVGRLIMTPGMLTGYYYEFFGENEHIYMSDSVLGFMSEYPYELPPDQIIGGLYRGDPTINANANIWADSFANFGLSGMIVFAVILGVMLWLFDSLARNRNQKMTILMLGLPAITLSNTALETSILTHGIGLVFLLLYLMPPKSDHREHSLSGGGDR